MGLTKTFGFVGNVMGLNKELRAGLVNRVERDLRNSAFVASGGNPNHDAKGRFTSGPKESASATSINKAYAELKAKRAGATASPVEDFASTFEGAFDPHKLMDSNPKIAEAGSVALDAITSVHGIEKGHPAAIAMVDNGEWLGEDDGSLGAYMPPEPGLERGRVVFRAGNSVDSMASTLVHELGHHMSIGRGVDAWRAEVRKPGALRDLMQTIEESPTKQDLNGILDKMNEKGVSGDEKGFVEYLSMPEELYARAYYQYIADRTKRTHTGLARELVRTLKDDNNSIMQWTPKEFEPIGRSMDAYLKSRGLT